MRKKKWKKLLFWFVSITVILGVGGLFAANYAVDKIISTLAADLENDLLSEDKVVVVTTDKQNDDKVDGNNQKAPDNAEEATTEPKVDAEKSNQISNITIKNDFEEPEKQDKSSEGYSAEVSVDKVKDVQEKITVSEKAQVSSVLLKELSISDINQIQALASGGLSLEEKKQARSIILDKLSAEQYDELIQVAKKYGMSQGKSYDQVMEEK